MAIWMMQAERKLRHSIAPWLCAHRNPNRTDRKVTSTIKRLNKILKRTFPRADHVVVRDQLTGFRGKGETWVLLVEVDGGDQVGPYVVKIGRPGQMEAELRGWKYCRPAGLHHDLILLPLKKGCRLPTKKKPKWMSLVYGDAQQFIGMDRTVTFEEAFLSAVRYGTPSVQSVNFVIVQLLERLGHLLYATSFVEDPADPNYEFDMPRVERAVTTWKKDVDYRSIRTDTNVLATHGASRFIDPVDYFQQWVFSYFPPPHGRWSSGAAASDPSPPGPRDLIPRMLRGCAHGDLHGRNILVGWVNDRALWPTVFDYEDMGPSNLPGWDFVKLETELKIRAFCEIFPRDELPFIEAVHDFENSLNERTRQCDQNEAWATAPELDSSADRLTSALLELRHMASLHLGRNRGRPKRWLEEYYFLLAAYGINTANYTNLDRRHLVAAYVCSGVATARLSWPRLRAPLEHAMTKRISTVKAALETRFISYTRPLEIARRWLRSSRSNEAIELLKGLFDRFPHSLEIGEQLILANLEEKKEDDARAVLDRLSLLSRNPNEEVLCRRGRLCRDQGRYGLALDEYKKAYQIRFGHYPGINVASLHLLIAALETDPAERMSQSAASRSMAQELLDRRNTWPCEMDDDPVWHFATAGEANLLLQNWDVAAECYEAAQYHAKCQPFHRESMRKQALRIIHSHKQLGVTSFGPFANLQSVFPCPP